MVSITEGTNPEYQYVSGANVVYFNGNQSGDFTVEDVVKNDYIDGANEFDAAKVKADADGFKLSADYEAVDVDAIKAAL